MACVNPAAAITGAICGWRTTEKRSVCVPPWLGRVTSMGIISGMRPISPYTAERRSWLMVPMTGPMLATLKEFIRLGRIVMTSEAAIGRSTAPRRMSG